MPGEQRCSAPLPSAGASGVSSRPPRKNHAPAGGTPKASREEVPEAQSDPDGGIEPWALLLGSPPLSSPHQPCTLRVGGSGARPPQEGTPESLPCGEPRAHVRPDAPRAEAPPAPKDLSFQRGFPDPLASFAPHDYGSPRPPPLRAPPSGGRSPCRPGSYSDLGALGAQAWPHSAFGVSPAEPQSFPYPFVAPGGAGLKSFSEGAVGQPCARGIPLFASPRAPGEWPDQVSSPDPTYPLPMPSGPTPPLCYPSQPRSLSTPQDLSGAGSEAGAAPPAPSPFSGSPASFLEGLHGPPHGRPGEPPSSLRQGQFPGASSLDLPLVSAGLTPTGLPQLWGPATPHYPTGPPLATPAAAGMAFLDQPSLPQDPSLPWAQVLPAAGPSTQQMVLSPPPFPPGAREWPGVGQGALGGGRPGGELGALGTNPRQPGSSPRPCAYDGPKDPGASVLRLSAEQPQVSPQDPPLPPEVVASPGESPLPSPAVPTAGSSCSSLSPPSGSPADPSSEDSQLPGLPGLPTFFPAPTLPGHYQPVAARPFPEDTGAAQGAFRCLQTAPAQFPEEAPCSEQHFLDQLGVLLTCRQCDQNYSSVAAFLGHRPFCSPLQARPKDAPPQPPGSPTPPATPKAPAEGVPGPFPLPGTGPPLLDEGKEEALSASLLPAAPFPPPAALDLDLEDAAKLDSLIAEALHGLECQAHSPDIDSSFIDVFTDEETPGPRAQPSRPRAGVMLETPAGAGPQEPPQPRVGSPPACSRPQTRSRGPASAGGGRLGPTGQQRRGKRFRLPMQERGLAMATTTVQRPGRGSRLTPRRKSSRKQAPGSRAESRKVLRRRARGRTWNKDLIHKIVEQKQKRRGPPGLLSLPPATRRPHGPDSGLEDDEGPRPRLSCPRGSHGEKRKEMGWSPGPQAGGTQLRPRKAGRPEGRGGVQGTAAPLMARDSAASPGHPWPGPSYTAAPEDPAQSPPSPEIAHEISQGTPTPLRERLDAAGPLVSSGGPPEAPQPCTVALSSGLGAAPALVNGVSSGASQPYSKAPHSCPHQGLSTPSNSVAPQAGPGHLDWDGGSVRAPLPGDRPPRDSPPSSLAPSSPLPDSGCVPLRVVSPHPGGPAQGQSELQLDIRRPVTELEGQLETPPGQPSPAEHMGAPWAAPEGPFSEVSLIPGSDAAMATDQKQVALGSLREEWGATLPLSKTGLPKAEGDWGTAPGESCVLTTRSELPAISQSPEGRRDSGHTPPCRQRAGRGPRAPRAGGRSLVMVPCSNSDTHLAPNVVFGGVGVLSRGRTPPRISPQDGQAGLVPVPRAGGDLPPLPQLPAVGRGDSSGSEGPPLATDTHRPLALQGSCVKGGWRCCREQTAPPAAGSTTPDSEQLRPDSPTQPEGATKQLIVGASPALPTAGLKDPTEEEPPTAPLQRAPEPPPLAISTPSAQQGPLLDSAPRNQACCPGVARPGCAGAHLEDKPGIPTGPRKDSLRGSPSSRSIPPRVPPPVPERSDTVGAVPHTSRGPALGPPDHTACLGPDQGTDTGPSDTADATTATGPSTEPCPHTATPPLDPRDSGSREDGAAYSCEICSAIFHSRAGLSRHRARKHGLRRAADPQLCAPTLPAPQPQEPPRKKGHRLLRKERLRQAPVGPSPVARKPPPEAPRPEPGAGCALRQELNAQGGPGKGSRRARHRPWGAQAEPEAQLSGHSPEYCVDERAGASGAQGPCGDPHVCVPPARSPDSPDPSTVSGCSPASTLLLEPEPEAHGLQPPAGASEMGPGPATAGLESDKGCGVRVTPSGSMAGSRVKRRRGRREPGMPSKCQHPSRVAQGPPQPPRSRPESLKPCGSRDGVQELKDNPPTASGPGLGAPTHLSDCNSSAPRPCPLGSLPTQKKSPEVFGKRRRNRTKPHGEPAGTCDTGTRLQPPGLNGSGSFCPAERAFLPDGCAPWGPHPSLWALEPHSTGPPAQDLPRNIPELDKVPAARRGSGEEPPPSQGSKSPEPPSLEREADPSVPPTGTLDLQMLSVKLEVPDLCFLGSCEDSAVLPGLGGRDLRTTASPPTSLISGAPSQAQHGQAQKRAHKLSCLQHFHGLAELDKLSHSPPLPPTCYMCVERRFGSSQLLREHLQEKHAQSRPGPWACGMCLLEVADIWTYNAHLRDHAVSFAHHGPEHGAPGWQGHSPLPHFLSGLVGTVLRPHGDLAGRSPDEVSGPELPGSESPAGRGSALAGAPSPPRAPPTTTLLGCRDVSRDCHHCGRSFPKPFKLQRHLPVHSPLRIYLCPQCPRVYLEHGTLRAHLGTEHGPWAEQEVPPTALFSCELCADVACASKRTFACSTCNFTFAKKDQLHRHLDKHRRRTRPPAPLRCGRRPRAPWQGPLGREGTLPSKRCRVAMPGSPPLPSLPQPLSPASSSPELSGVTTCPDPPLSCLDMATSPTEGSGEPMKAPPRGPQAPPEPLSPAPVHSKGSCKQAAASQGCRGEEPRGCPCPPAQRGIPPRLGPRDEGCEERVGGLPPGMCRTPGAPDPCPESLPTAQKPDSKCHPAPRAGSKGLSVKPGGCQGLPKDRLGGTTTGRAPQFPAQHKKAARSPLPSGPRHGRGTGGCLPQPASGQLQSEAASTPTKTDPAGQSPTTDRPPSRPPAGGCSRGPCNTGERGTPGSREARKSSEERRKSQAPLVPDKPPRAPRKQATPCRVLPTKFHPGPQSGRTPRQALDQGTHVLGDPKQRGLAKIIPQADPLHRRPKRGRASHTAGPPSPHALRTAESQSHLLNQLFGQRLSRFKIPLKKGPSV